MDANQASLQIIADLLEQKTGQTLSENRRWRVSTALSGVFREHGLDNVDQLVCLIESQKTLGERSALQRQVVEALLNNETYFFRDKQTFDQISDFVLPYLARKRSREKRLSIWCSGCSTGQEVHSVAMLFADNPERWRGWTIDLLGTDISEHAIKTARRGLYTQFEVQRGLGVIEMLRHFDESQQGWQIKDETRQWARFERHNLLSEPPAHAQFDLILCRNVLLYFDGLTRAKVFRRLASAMRCDGYLMLGAGETVVGQTSDFAPCSDLVSLYQRKDESAVPASAGRALVT